MLAVLLSPERAVSGVVVVVVVEDIDVAGGMVLEVERGVGGMLVDEDELGVEGEDEDEAEDAIEVEAVGISVTDRAAGVKIILPRWSTVEFEILKFKLNISGVELC